MSENEHVAENAEQEPTGAAEDAAPAAVAEAEGTTDEGQEPGHDAPEDATDGDSGDEGEAPAGDEAPRAEEEEAPEPEEQLTPEQKRLRAQETRFFAAIGFQRALDGLKELCQGPLGRAVVGRMRVLYDEEGVRTCLEQTREMMALLRSGGRGLRTPELLEPRSILARAKGDRPLDARDLEQVRALLSSAREVRQALEGLEEGRAPRLQALAQHLDPVPAVLEKLDAALERERGGLADAASEKLGEVRTKLRAAREEVDRMLGDMAREATVAIALHNPRPVVRNNRLVLAVKAQQKAAVPGEVVTRGQGGQILFVEPEKSAAKNAEVVALMQEERAELTAAAWELTRLIQAHEALLERTAGTLGWIDFTRAKALWALERNYEVPSLALDGTLVLADARHPLLETSRRERSGRGNRGGGGEEASAEVRPVVPISLTLGGQHDLIVISGPKQGGKTVVLRTVGLCAVMAQCGLPIPAAARSTIPVSSGFFADISEGRGGPASRSLYAAHLQRARELLREAGKGALVLIDELGAGTSPEEGAALGQSLLEKLLAAGARTLVTTDLRSLSQFALGQARAEVAALAFDSEKGAPAYRLLVGQPGSTHSLEAAARADLPGEVVSRARELLGGDGQKVDQLVTRLESALVQADADRQRSEQLKQAALAEKKVLEDERHTIERKKQALAMEADLEQEETFLKLQRAVRETTDKLKGAGGAVTEELAALQKRVDELLSHTPFEQKRRDFAQKLKRGAYVYVVSLGQVGEVVKIQRDKGKLSVACGPLTIDTTFDNVSWVETKGLPQKAATTTVVGGGRYHDDAETGREGDDKNDEYGFRKGQRPTNYTGTFGGGGRFGGGGGGGRGPR